MRKLLFLLFAALFFGLNAYSQTTENVSFQKVVSFRGSFTTAERDLLDVPVGDVWMIYNSTAAILEYAREDDVWGAVGGGAADNLGADANRSLFTVSGAGTIATLNLNTVDSTHIKNGSIESNDFADNSITTAKILNGTIVGADIANDAILSGKIADGTILPADLDAINAPVVGYHLALDASNQFVWVTPTAGSVAALADLSDVSSATQGNRFALLSNGATFSSRALLEADISDLSHTVDTDDQNARQVSVLDAGARFDSINVEGVLEELYDKWVVGNDDQLLTFISPNLSIENGNSVDLSVFLDNTDAQTLSFADPNLSITGGNSVDLSVLKDGTGTDDQTAAEVSVTTTSFNGHLSAADTNVQLALDTLDDLVAGGSQTLSFASPNLSISGGNSVDISAIDTNTQRTDEEIQDVAGAMATGNTETLITVTYQDADGTTDYVVNSDLSLYNNATSNFSTGAHTTDTDDQVASEVPSTPAGNLAATDVQAALNELQTDVDTRSVGAHTTNTDSQTLSIATNNLSISGGNSVSLTPYLDNTDAQTLSFTSPNLSISGGNSVSLAALDTNTQRTDEEIQDVAGAMATGNTETLITVTYQDADGTMDYVVNSDLSLYNNATSNFSTGAHTTDTDDQTAAEVSYTNTTSGLAAIQVQAALDEIEARVDVNDAKTSGVTDHGALTGLADDDHTQYHTDARASTWLTTTYPNLDTDATNDVILSGNQVVGGVKAMEAIQIDGTTAGFWGLTFNSGADQRLSFGYNAVDGFLGTNLRYTMPSDGVPANGTDVINKTYADANYLGTDDQTAAEVPVTATGFDGVLTTSDTDVQLVAQALDDLADTEIASALSPANYTPASSTVRGQFQGIDAALGTLGGTAYLPLTGGTLSGALTVNAALTAQGFTANYFETATAVQSLAVANNWDTEDMTVPFYSIWTASNTTGSTGFPNATGQALFVKGATDARSFAFWNTASDNDPDGLYSGYMNAGSWVWNEMWTAGSDGAGSGLDADLIDGFSGSSSGDRWGVYTPVATDGVLEIGRYIDFHNTDADATDNTGRLDNTTNEYLRFSGGGGTQSVIEAYDGSLDWTRVGANASGGYVSISDGAGGSATIIRGYGNSDFYQGNITVHSGTVTATNFILSSDRRLKRRVRDYELQKLDVRWRSYFMNDDPMHIRYGVIAQELKENHPEFIREDENGMMSVSYVDLLVAKNAELEARIEDLETLVQQLIKDKK